MKCVVTGTGPFEMNFFNDDEFEKLIKISSWERVKLFFKKKQYHHDKLNNTLTTYKMMNGKIYVLNIQRVPPVSYNCRCVPE